MVNDSCDVIFPISIKNYHACSQTAKLSSTIKKILNMFKVNDKFITDDDIA